MEESKRSPFIQNIDKPIYDAKGKELKVGMKVKILISEFIMRLSILNKMKP